VASQQLRRAIEHGSSKNERFLHANRYKLALALVIAEALLIAFGSLSLWLALAISGLVLVAYLLGREELHGTARELAWVVAASQAVGVLVFVLAFVAAVLVIVAIVALAVLSLVMLFGERR
jgi:hypothetical protein